MEDFSQVVPTSTILQDVPWTWGFQLGHVPPWPADCRKCGSRVGTYDDPELLKSEVRAHQGSCRWLRRKLRRLDFWLWRNIGWTIWRRTRAVRHVPVWESADLPINAEGDTKPGFVCVHELENGNGRCGANVFDRSGMIGDCACIVWD